MIEKKRHISEMYDLKHINDKSTAVGYDYENNIYERTMSSYLFKNPTLVDYIKQIQKSSVWMINSVVFVRNFFDSAFNF